MFLAESRVSGKVASRAEAWIEIDVGGSQPHTHSVASRAEAWIEITCATWAGLGGSRRLPRGGVD